MDNAGMRAKGTQGRNERDEMTAKKRVSHFSSSALSGKEAFTCDANKFVCTRATFLASGINRPLGEKFPSEASSIRTDCIPWRKQRG